MKRSNVGQSLSTFFHTHDTGKVGRLFKKENPFEAVLQLIENYVGLHNDSKSTICQVTTAIIKWIDFHLVKEKEKENVSTMCMWTPMLMFVLLVSTENCY